MARAGRLNKRRFNTEKVQGHGSYIVFRKPSFLDAQTFVGELREVTREIGNPEKSAQVEDEMVEMLFDKASEQFVEWNWVDDEGEPLLGLNEMEDFNLLLQEEVDEIIDAVRNLYGIVREDREGKSVV